MDPNGEKLKEFLVSTLPPMTKNTIRSMLASGADPAVISSQLDIPLPAIEALATQKGPSPDAPEISDEQYRALIDNVYNLGMSADSPSVQLAASLALIERKKPSKGTNTTIDVRVTFNNAIEEFNKNILETLNAAAANGNQPQ